MTYRHVAPGHVYISIPWKGAVVPGARLKLFLSQGEGTGDRAICLGVKRAVPEYKCVWPISPDARTCNQQRKYQKRQSVTDSGCSFPVHAAIIMRYRQSLNTLRYATFWAQLTGH